MGLAAAASAAEKACSMPFSGLGEKTARLGLEVCPGAPVTPDEGFRRTVLEGSAVLVRTFLQTAAEPCLARVDRRESNDVAGRFGSTCDKL